MMNRKQPWVRDKRQEGRGSWEGWPGTVSARNVPGVGGEVGGELLTEDQFDEEQKDWLLFKDGGIQFQCISVFSTWATSLLFNLSSVSKIIYALVTAPHTVFPSGPVCRCLLLPCLPEHLLLRLGADVSIISPKSLLN